MDLIYAMLLKLVAPQLSCSEGKWAHSISVGSAYLEVGLSVSGIVDTSHTSRTEHDPWLILAP